MADDFTGVPEHEWWRTWRDASIGRALAEFAIILLVVLIVALVSKGVISWADLLPTHAHE